MQQHCIFLQAVRALYVAFVTREDEYAHRDFIFSVINPELVANIFTF